MPNDDNSLSNQLLKLLEDYIPFVTSDGNRDQIINYLVFLAGLAWVYCGIKIYFDIGKRYRINGLYQFLALIIGVITGPFGLLIYLLMRPNFTQEEVDFIKIEHKFYYQQAAKVLECIKCNSYVLEGQTFCTDCGTKNRYECVSCNTLTDYNDKYCFHCGHNFKNRYAELLKEVGKTQPIVENKRQATREILPSEPKESQLSVYVRHLKRGFIKIFDFGGNIRQTLSAKPATLEASPLTVSKDNSLKNDYVTLESTKATETEVENKPAKNKNRKRNKKHKK